MKKSQRLRLTELLGKKSTGTLSAADQLELAWLNALASANPDAGKDEDDSPSGFRVALMEAVSGRKTLGADLAKATARITELESQLKAAAEKAATPALPEGALASADVTKLRDDLKAEQGTVSALNAQLAVFGTALGIKTAELAGKSEADVRTAVEKRLGALAGEKIAELGFPENKLPASTQAGSSSTGDEYADLQAQLATERDPVKAGQIAARANKLRDQQWASGRN
ncbi:MAG TPA: hypothetical protein VLH79_06910 [Chthonomonadales bacterium]|nr:hypothetical protein [Chthonomonadales bacterium]